MTKIHTHLRLKAFFGGIPSAEKIEKQEEEAKRDYEKLKEIENSEDFKTFVRLRDFIESPDFEQKKKEINSVKWNGSEAQQKEKRYKELAKSKEIKTYFKIKDSEILQHYENIKNSEKLERFEELEDFFKTDELNKYKESLKQQQEEKKTYRKETLSKHKLLKNQYGWIVKYRESGVPDEMENLKTSNSIVRLEDIKDKAKKVNVSQLKAHYKSINKEKAKEEPKEDYKDSDEFKLLAEYKQLKRATNVKKYYKTLHSKKYTQYQELKDSADLREYEELTAYIQGDEFKNIPAEIKKLDYKNSSKYKEDFQEYKQLKNDSDLKRYFKFAKSKDLKIYEEVKENTQLLNEYEELKEYVEGDEFKEKKRYLKLKDKFKESGEYQDYLKYKELKKSADIKWYYKNKDSDRYDFIINWERTFYDDFDKPQLDAEKWLTSYYWGKTLMNDSYVQAGSKHFYTDGNNIDIANSNCKITTKEEKTKGKVWHPALGFYVNDFNYTSGMINTAKSFNQKYGYFRAKVKLGNAYPLRHSFWLVTNKILPQIDIFNYAQKSASQIEMNTFTGNNPANAHQDKSIVKGLNFSKKHYIFSIEWTPESIVWRINGLAVKEQTSNIPNEPMYIMLNSGLHQDIKPGKLPADMEIDWVEAYVKKQN